MARRGNTGAVLATAASGGAIREFYVDLALGDGWIARYRLRDQDGVPVVSELHVFHRSSAYTRISRADRDTELLHQTWSGVSDVPVGGLTASRLRSVTVGSSIIKLAHTELSTWPADLRRTLGGLAGQEPPKKASRRVRGDRFYAELAARYVGAYHTDPRRPVALLAEQLGWERDQVRDALHDARRAGMLTSGVAGTAGGELTEQAKAILRDKGKDKR